MDSFERNYRFLTVLQHWTEPKSTDDWSTGILYRISTNVQWYIIIL